MSEYRLVLTRNVSAVASEAEAIGEMASVLDEELNSYSQEGRHKAALMLAGQAALELFDAPRDEIEKWVSELSDPERIALIGLRGIISHAENIANSRILDFQPTAR